MNLKRLNENLRYILNEFASQRKDAIQELKSMSRPYTEHICKYILWSNVNTDWKQDWQKEIVNYIYQITSIILKGNKRLKKRDYIEYFFKYRLENVEELTLNLQGVTDYYTKLEHYPVPHDTNCLETFNKYTQFVDSILDFVAKGIFNSDVIIEGLEKLGGN